MQESWTGRNIAVQMISSIDPLWINSTTGFRAVAKVRTQQERGAIYASRYPSLACSDI